MHHEAFHEWFRLHVSSKQNCNMKF
uniref:Uncharacterized protein n=1 Tax=Arundo donax TaxID=35708 RepID=A0A0A9FWL8_ARUDO